MTGARLQGLVESLAASEEVTAAVAQLIGPDGTTETAGAGSTRAGAAPDAATLFDLASLTKLFSATLGLLLDRSGALPLETRLGELWPRAAAALGDRTCEDLLRHRSGLRAWAPLYHRCADRGEAIALLLSGELCDAPEGTYSDMGYVLWGLTAERATGRPLAELFEEQVLARIDAPLRAGPGVDDTAVESLLDNDRERRLARAQGLEVAVRERPGPAATQDGNAHFLGGLAAQAGLFGSAAAVVALAREWLTPSRWLEPAAVARALGGGGDYALGWARKPVFKAWGEGLEAGAVGHVGFTGSAVWIEPASRRIAVLLASRDSDRVDLGPWRRRLQELSAGE